MSATQLIHPVELFRNPQSQGATSISTNRRLGAFGIWDFAGNSGKMAISSAWRRNPQRWRSPHESSALDYSEFEEDEERQGEDPALLSYLDAAYWRSGPSKGGSRPSNTNGGSRSRDF